MPRGSHRSRQTLAIIAMLRDAAPGWMHGYALMQATGLKSGTLYPALIRLDDDGLLESRWFTDESNGRPRRLYRLSPAGLQFADRQISGRSMPGCERAGA